MSEYKQGFYQLADILERQMHDMGVDSFMSMLANMDSIRNSMCELYWMLVKSGKCVPLEQLPEEEKAALWEEAKRISVDPCKKKVVNTCKAIHAIGSYLQTKN